MNPLLKAKIQGYYSREASREFFDHFEESGFAQLLRLPLLENASNATGFHSSESLAGFDFSDNHGLVLKNRSGADRTLVIESRFPKKPSLEELFRAFNLVTHNVVTLDDLRVNPEFFLDAYSGLGYFFFHGDGYCSSLAFMMQSFLEVMGGYEVDLGYCRTQDGHYTHAYCRDGSRLIDPALKTLCELDSLRTDIPYGWIYTLIKRGSMLVYDDILPSDRTWLFSERQLRNLEFMNSGNHQAVYRSDASMKEIFKVFQGAFFDHSTEMSILKDDFRWKPVYRGLVEKRAGKKGKPYFFGSVSKPLEWILPAGSELSLGDKADPTGPLLRILEAIYYGRSFARLKISLRKGESKRVVSPETPLLVSVSSPGTISLNGKAVTPSEASRPDLRGPLRYLGSSVLEGRDNVFEADRDLEISAYLPINALFWNSSYWTFGPGSDFSGLEIKHR